MSGIYASENSGEPYSMSGFNTEYTFKGWILLLIYLVFLVIGVFIGRYIYSPVDYVRTQISMDAKINV